MGNQKTWPLAIPFLGTTGEDDFSLSFPPTSYFVHVPALLTKVTGGLLEASQTSLALGSPEITMCSRDYLSLADWSDGIMTAFSLL